MPSCPQWLCGHSLEHHVCSQWCLFLPEIYFDPSGEEFSVPLLPGSVLSGPLYFKMDMNQDIFRMWLLLHCYSAGSVENSDGVRRHSSAMIILQSTLHPYPCGSFILFNCEGSFFLPTHSTGCIWTAVFQVVLVCLDNANRLNYQLPQNYNVNL